MAGLPCRNPAARGLCRGCSEKIKWRTRSKWKQGEIKLKIGTDEMMIK